VNHPNQLTRAAAEDERNWIKQLGHRQ